MSNTSQPERLAKPEPRECDLSEQCIHCGARMRQEHAHYRCPQCGNRDACCEGIY